MKNNLTYNILIIDSSIIILNGLKYVLSQLNKEYSIDYVSSLQGAQEKIALYQPNLIIINPSLVDYSKRSSFKSQLGSSPLIALTYEFFDSNYLNQFNDSIEINDDIHKIQATLNKYLNSPLPLSNTDSDSNELSDREIEILIAITKGLINKEIADLLNISVHTVMSHRKNITRKTGIKSVSGLTLYAVLNNYISPQELG